MNLNDAVEFDAQRLGGPREIRGLEASEQRVGGGRRILTRGCLLALFATVVGLTPARADSAVPLTVSVTGDYYLPNGTASVGDAGHTFGRSVSRWSPSVVLAWNFSPSFSLEVGYRHIPKVTYLKWASPAVFADTWHGPAPGTTSAAMPVIGYELENEGDSGSLGLAYRARLGSSVTLSASVFGAALWSRSTLAYPALSLPATIPGGSNSAPNSVTDASVLVGELVPYDSSSLSLRPGARIGVAYRFWTNLSVKAEYEFIDAKVVRGSYVGAGISADF
ncbi:hypothetical protein GALL_40520 [mine drainage metagenome]|uniref:Outer membrane protein beta-barrel domain-containing protein n=1 Tax=mine drainage metagenome TaxID=410659 RepID=A0A1J5TFI4_9ZZZZ